MASSSRSRSSSGSRRGSGARDSRKRRYILNPSPLCTSGGGSQPLRPLWGSCEAEVNVAAAVEDALAEQWRVVYDPDSSEKDRERGGLVLRNGSVNPGHFCFNPILTCQLSPLSQITTLGGGAVRLGDCGEVYAGWDHTEVLGPDPTTHKHTESVYAHFHVHADNADLLSHRCNERTVSTAVPAAAAAVTHDVGTSASSDTTFQAEQKNGSNGRHLLRPASAPSLGDIGAWLCYHRNQPRAFVLTRDASWLLFKWQMPGHAKDGIECPSDAIAVLLDQCNRRKFESLYAAADLLLQELPQHGFAIYVRKLADRPPNTNGIYRLWVPSTEPSTSSFKHQKHSDQSRCKQGGQHNSGPSQSTVCQDALRGCEIM